MVVASEGWGCSHTNKRTNQPIQHNKKTTTKNGTKQDVPALEIFAGKKVVIVGVPGALTPTCSETHVPGENIRLEYIKD
jgi:peroxiredoxin